MANQYKTFEELYTREQIRKIGEVYRTNPKFDWEYCPIVFNFPRGFEYVCSSAGNELCIHIKAEYLYMLWQKALEITRNKYPNFLKHNWKKEGYFRFIYYSDSFHEESIDYFWKQLPIIANSKQIIASERESIDKDANKIFVYESKLNFCKQGYRISKNPKSVSYSWDEVKQFFIELSDKEVSFLHGNEMNDYNPSSQPLFDACKNHDLQEVKKAIESGIDVNSIDKYANTPICSVIPMFDDEKGAIELSKQDPHYTDKVIKILDYLLGKGANINLYGFEGNDILTNAHFCANLRLIEYLFEHGVSRYSNCFITDLYDDMQWYTMNAAYDYTVTDISIGDYDTENLEEQEKILEKYGVQFFIDGWDNDKLDKYYDTLPDLDS